MGSYLSEPVTEKISTDEGNDKLVCGASSMQGWRVSQEDAHNCLLEFDKNTALFAVYDGHGGHEVAHYCAKMLPDFIKAMEAYKNGDMEKALIDAFLGFDATIATREVVSILKEIAGDKEAEEDSEEEENVNNLYEEAAMPIEQVIEKYTSNLLNPAIKNVKDGDKQPVSPFLKAKKTCEGKAGGSSSSGDTKNLDNASDEVSSSTAVIVKVNSSKDEEPTSTDKVENGVKIPDIKVHSPDSSADKNAATPSSNNCQDKVKGEVHQNGETDIAPSVKAVKDGEVTSHSTPTENGDVPDLPKKGKGKALAKTRGAKAPNTRPKRSVQQIYAKLLDFEGESDDSSDEEDKTFEGPNDDSSDDETEGLNASLEGDNSSDEDGDDEDEDDDDELEGDDDEDEADMEFAKNMREEPGSDSGCTAVVALLKENKLYVANAGDSRCIVCRRGKAVEMSFDHKPEDEPERNRVHKAGGNVTQDGRVNGGLNLSRAIGDHAYKQNTELSDREQMITALPDVRTLEIDESEDEFMVLACDGIWNFMSSQEVVDFVRPCIQEGTPLSKICEEMFDHCLAPNTMGDGTGCDNMTAIIIKFKQHKLKRSASPEPEEPDNIKRIKTDESKTNADAEKTAA